MRKLLNILAALVLCVSFTVFTAYTVSACDTCGCSVEKHSHDEDTAPASMTEEMTDVENQMDAIEQELPEGASWEEMEQSYDALDPQEPATE